jgi:VanZ family protein
VAWAVAWCLAALVLVLSLGPAPPGAESFPAADKVVHGLGYALTVLAFLLAAVWRPGSGPGPFPGMAVWIVVLGIAAGGVIEAAQGLFFDRDAELADLLADAVGAGVAWAAFAALRTRLSPTTERAGG